MALRLVTNVIDGNWFDRLEPLDVIARAVVQIVDEGRANRLYVQAAHTASTAAQISGVVCP